MSLWIAVAGVGDKWTWKVKDQEGRVVYKGKKTEKSAKAARRAAARRIDAMLVRG